MFLHGETQACVIGGILLLGRLCSAGRRESEGSAGTHLSAMPMLAKEDVARLDEV